MFCRILRRQVDDVLPSCSLKNKKYLSTRREVFFFPFFSFFFFLSFFFSRTLTVNSLQKYIEGWKEEEEKERESRNSGELYLLYLIKNRESVWYGKVYFSLTSQCVYTLFLPFFSKRKLCFTIVFLINSFPQRFPAHRHTYRCYRF